MSTIQSRIRNTEPLLDRATYDSFSLQLFVPPFPACCRPFCCDICFCAFSRESWCFDFAANWLWTTNPTIVVVSFKFRTFLLSLPKSLRLVLIIHLGRCFYSHLTHFCFLLFDGCGDFNWRQIVGFHILVESEYVKASNFRATERV